MKRSILKAIEDGRALTAKSTNLGPSVMEMNEILEALEAKLAKNYAKTAGDEAGAEAAKAVMKALKSNAAFVDVTLDYFHAGLAIGSRRR